MNFPWEGPALTITELVADKPYWASTVQLDAKKLFFCKNDQTWTSMNRKFIY